MNAIPPLALALALALSAPIAAAAAPVRTVERLGPFTLGPNGVREVRVVATYLELPGAPPEAFARALEAWRVETASGATIHEESLAVEMGPDGRELAFERSLWAGRIVGGPAPLLLVEIGELPSAPGSGEIWSVFELDAADRLRELGRFEQQGRGLLNERDPRGDVPLAEGRFLDLDLHLGYFSVVFRYELDPERRRFVASARCAEPLDARREPEYAHDAVMLRARPAPESAARILDAKAAATVELLEACLDRPPAPAEPLDPGTSGLWVRVRIDGVEGWLGPADLDRLGVLFAG